MNEPPKQKALFLDRDGTINIEKNYVYKIDDFEFQPGIFDLIRKYQEDNFLIFIITNQSGIARGFYSEHDFEILNNWMLDIFKSERIKITKVYYCPHHPDITGTCDCRKPKAGMIYQAIEQFNISAVNSVLIGDKKRDILAGENAGIGKNLYIQKLLGEGIF